MALVTLTEVVPVAQAMARTLIYIATIWLVGGLMVLGYAMPRAGLPADVSARVAPQLWRCVRWAAWLALCAYLVRFYVQMVDAYLSLLPTWYATYMLLFWTLGWGKGVLAQFIVSLLIWLSLLRIRIQHARRWTLYGLAMTSAVAVPFTGHAIAHGGIPATIVQGLHVFAAGAWLGSLAVIVLAWRTRVLPEVHLADVLAAFSTYARWSVLTLVASGAGALFIHLEAPSDMLRTQYGLVLLAKVVLFAGAAVLGLFHWQSMVPGIQQQGPRRLFQYTVGLELALGFAAVVLVGFLTGLPRPGDLVR